MIISLYFLDQLPRFPSIFALEVYRCMLSHNRADSLCYSMAVDRFGIWSLQFLRTEALNFFSYEAECELNTELEIGGRMFFLSGSGLLVCCAAQLL